MELGNALVARGFAPWRPGMGIGGGIVTSVGIPVRSTWTICLFTDWLNGLPEARAELKKLGFAWPVVEEKVHDQKSDRCEVENCTHKAERQVDCYWGYTAEHKKYGNMLDSEPVQLCLKHTTEMFAALRMERMRILKPLVEKGDRA